MSGNDPDAGEKCPVSLLSSAAIACPYHLYTELRAGEPVAFLADQNVWILTKYEDVEYVLSNPERFSSREALSSHNAYGEYPRAREVLKKSRATPPIRTLMFADPPRHGRDRTIVQRALQPAKTLRDVTPLIRDAVDALIDEFCETGRCEVASQFSTPLPMLVVGHIFSAEKSEIALLKRWSDSFFAALTGRVGEEAVVQAAEHTLEFEDYILDRVDRRRREPADDFLSRLLQNKPDEEPLSNAEIINICSQILVGGNESTINFLTNAVHQIATTDGLQDRLARDPALIPAFIEELLRFEAPLQFMYRICLEDETFGEVRVPKGSKLMLNFGSANRDEKFYEDGATFDLDRDNRETIHLSFGRGIHACAGQAFARREGVISVERLVARLPRIGIAETPERQTLVGVRGFRRLVIGFEPVSRLGEAGGGAS